jgi:hypothetical protein
LVNIGLQPLAVCTFGYSVLCGFATELVFHLTLAQLLPNLKPGLKAAGKAFEKVCHD